MDNIEQSTLTSFLGAFDELAGFSLVEEQYGIPYVEPNRHADLDALFTFAMPDGSKCLLAVEYKKYAYPRDVRTAIDHLQTFKHDQCPAAEPFFIADTISVGSRQVLKEAGVNFFDKSGTLYFKHGNWLIDVERPPAPVPRKEAGSLYTGAREQVVHALLEHWLHASGDAYLSGAELAVRSGTSTFTVSATMQLLERMDFVESKGTGPQQRRRLRDPGGLLDSWADAWVRRRDPVTRWYLYTPHQHLLDHVLESLSHATDWGITGAAAANTVVPQLTSVDRIEVIVPPGAAESLGACLGAKKADKGPNVILIERSGAARMFMHAHPERPGSRFAGVFIQYLDLLNGYGRNKELASEFRKRALKLDNIK